MTISTISPQQAQSKLASGAILMDIREHDEFAREHIQGAVCMPLEQLNTHGLPAQTGNCVIFCCQSGGRTQSACNQLIKLAENSEVEICVLDGGLNNWKAAGLAVEENKKAPLPMMRQVQIAAGSLILLGMLLGSTVSPLFYLLATFVGAGLVFAGVSGFCGMAVLLAKMPWNK